MVTSNFARGVTFMTLMTAGLLVGFYVQDVAMKRREARIEARVDAEVARRVALAHAQAQAAAAQPAEGGPAADAKQAALPMR